MLKALVLALVLVAGCHAQLICECDDGTALIQYYCGDPSPCRVLNCPADCGCPGGGHPGCDGLARQFTPVPKSMRFKDGVLGVYRKAHSVDDLKAQVAALNRALLVARL